MKIYRYYLLGRPDCDESVWEPLQARRVFEPSEVVSMYRQGSGLSPNVWVVPHCRDIDLLTSVGMPNLWNSLLMLDSPRECTQMHLTESLFGLHVYKHGDFQMLPIPDLVRALAAPNSQDLFIGGLVSHEHQVVILCRGNLKKLIVPFRWFKPSPIANPDFGDFEVTDCGTAIRLGEYEASSDAILYDFDPEFRRRYKRNLIACDDSFGGCLRRLRLQRGLKRSDFSPLDEKTVGRIERGEIEKPHSKTIEILANRLGVKPVEIETY